MRFTLRRRRPAYSLTDVVVVVILIAMLTALWIPGVAKARERASRQTCMSRLYNIRQAISAYQSTYQSPPRATYDPDAPIDLSNTGAAARSPFAKDGPPPNNVPAAFFLLMRTEMILPQMLICPAGDFTVDDKADADPTGRSNFTDVRRNMGYSIAVPYSRDFTKRGGTMGVPMAADLNPGVAGPDDDVRLPPNAPPDQLRKGNSNNHRKRGQNVLYDDGQVRWVTTPFAGHSGDNIYTSSSGKVIDLPADAYDAILLPTDH